MKDIFAEGEYDKFRVIRDATYKSDFDIYHLLSIFFKNSLSFP